ncbi:MAG: molybdopterin-guanine dinucleotide biosynthesis protein B [Hydrogenophilus sp.]|nr:molybdopterin-guanine dinucleotide biosynthesis protein B [Hydrogenophilus sp.]
MWLGDAMRVIGFVGWSGAGKTTTIEQVVPLWRAQGLRVGSVKHTHHEGFDLDTPGKDSWRHRAAGVERVLIVGPQRWALLTEGEGEEQLPLAAQLRLLTPCDLVVVEGFRRLPIPKVEVFRPELGRAPMWVEEERVVVVAVPGGEEGLRQWGLRCDRAVVDLRDASAVAQAAAQWALPIGRGEGLF